jgi:hypothetical protein
MAQLTREDALFYAAFADALTMLHDIEEQPRLHPRQTLEIAAAFRRSLDALNTNTVRQAQVRAHQSSFAQAFENTPAQLPMTGYSGDERTFLRADDSGPAQGPPLEIKMAEEPVPQMPEKLPEKPSDNAPIEERLAHTQRMLDLIWQALFAIEKRLPGPKDD